MCFMEGSITLKAQPFAYTNFREAKDSQNTWNKLS